MRTQIPRPNPGRKKRTNRHPDSKPALANLRGEQIANFGEEPPLAYGKLMENQNAQQN